MGQQSKLTLSRYGLFTEAVETSTSLSLSDTTDSSTTISLRSPSGHDKNWNHPQNSPSSNLDNNLGRFERYNLSLRPIPGKGLGLFAVEEIPKGKTIIIERPALVWAPSHEEFLHQKQANPEQSWDSIKTDYLQKELDKLPKPKQGEIWSLSNHSENSKESLLLSIFRTNTFGFSEHEKLSGIYTFCARLNHSCDPNCSWRVSKTPESDDPKDRTINITAIKDIKVGEELTITYVIQESRVEERQVQLLKAYGFKCDCSRCVFELRNLKKLYAWPFDQQGKARLRFNPVRPRHAHGVGQGWDFLTMIDHISGEDATIHTDDIIAQETPLILLTGREIETISSSLFEKFQQLSSSAKKAYLRLYDWQFKPSTPEISGEESWPSYDLGSTDEEEFTSEEDLARKIGTQTRKRIIPQPEKLLNIWATNSFRLAYGARGVFSFASHLDHSCSPTSRVVWCDEQKILSLVATRSLKVGDQITVCYDSDVISNLSALERKRYLKDNYGFDCSCFRCYLDLNDVNGKSKVPWRTNAQNIDPLPLSEILAAGESISSSSNENPHDMKQLSTRDEVALGGLEGSLQKKWRGKICQKSTCGEAVTSKRLDNFRGSPPPVQGLVTRLLEECIWEGEDKRPEAVVYPHV